VAVVGRTIGRDRLISMALVTALREIPVRATLLPEDLRWHDLVLVLNSPNLVVQKDISLQEIVYAEVPKPEEPIKL
jgi:hypothetical protein